MRLCLTYEVLGRLFKMVKLTRLPFNMGVVGIIDSDIMDTVTEGGDAPYMQDKEVNIGE